MQLGIDEGQKLIPRCAIPMAQSVQQQRHFPLRIGHANHPHSCRTDWWILRFDKSMIVLTLPSHEEYFRAESICSRQDLLRLQGLRSAK
jgi:hypothetical protein